LHPPPPGGHEALGDVALAPAVMRRVDGEAERGIAVRNGALDMIVDRRDMRDRIAGVLRMLLKLPPAAPATAAA